MIIIFASIVLISTILLWFREIKPMFRMSDGCIKKVWNDTSMHGSSWAKIHVWPHIVGGIVWMGLLYLPWTDSPESIWGKFLVVFIIQSLWELAQIVTWSPNPKVQQFAVLWEPVTKFNSLPAVINVGLGLFWYYWCPFWFIPLNAGIVLYLVLNPVLNSVILQGIYTRVQHENYRGTLPFPFKKSIVYGMLMALAGTLVGMFLFNLLGI